ncbi:hypothetical protein ABZ615_23945 [Streptomyces sp. NPDC007325]|uniref:hypothetical protein n=1 Tax=unclassified Streptomyces TaxID=2593676 RepID=UPI0033BFF4DA
MSPQYTPHPDPRAVLADCEQRALEREGIPMFLALEDLTGPSPRVTDERAAAEGPALAALTRTYREQVRPEAQDDDLASLASVITVLARTHLDEEKKA